MTRVQWTSKKMMTGHNHILSVHKLLIITKLEIFSLRGIGCC